MTPFDHYGQYLWPLITSYDLILPLKTTNEYLWLSMTSFHLIKPVYQLQKNKSLMTCYDLLWLVMINYDKLWPVITTYGKLGNPCKKTVTSRDYSASCNFFIDAPPKLFSYYQLVKLKLKFKMSLEKREMLTKKGVTNKFWSH